MKTIWIFNHYAVTPDEPGGTRHWIIANELDKLGWAAHVIAAREGRKPPSTRIGFNSFMHRVRTTRAKGNGIRRFLSMSLATLAMYMFRWRRDIPRPDVIIGSTVHPGAALVAASLARYFRVPFVFEIRDLWPKTLIAFGALTAKHPVARILSAIEGRLVAAAAFFVSPLPRVDEYLEQNYDVDRDRFLWIPNGAFTHTGHDTPFPPEARPRRLGYFGAMGPPNALETLLTAVRHLVDIKPELADLVQIDLYGVGVNRNWLIARSKDLGLESIIRFRSPVDAVKVPALMSQFHGLLFLARNLPDLYQYGMGTNKLGQYLASGRPVVSAASYPENPIIEGLTGFSVPAEDVPGLAKALQRFVDVSWECLVEQGKNARLCFERQYNYASNVGYLSERLIQLLDAR